MAGRAKFTRIPKVNDLVYQGVPTEAISTYCCLSDYANNKTGLCWPKMETLAQTLNRSVRTVQRHLHLLRELGLIEFVERRRNQGRFSSYLYRVLHIVATTGQGSHLASARPIYRRTKRLVTPPYSPPKTDKAHKAQEYEWFFGESEEQQDKWKDYEWFFGSE